MPTAARPQGTRRPRGSRSGAGFSLLECLVALGILSVGVLGALAALTTALKYAGQSRALTQATYLAQQQIEIFAAMTSAEVLNLQAAPGYPDDPANPIDPDPNDGDLTSFNRRWTVQPDTPESGAMTLTVQVDWTDKLGNTRTVQLETVKADF